MGFKTVYKCLMDVFPQVDTRILKAVAIEHSKDAGVAVEVVLSEVLPFLTRQSAVPIPRCVNTAPISDGEAEHEEQVTGLRHREVRLVRSAGSSSEPRSTAEKDSRKADLSGILGSDSTHQEKRQDQPMVVSSDANANTNQSLGHIESEELILVGEPQRQEEKPGSIQTSKEVSNTLTQGIYTDHSQAFDSQNRVPSSMDHCVDISIRVGHEQIPLVMPISLVKESSDLSGRLADSHSQWKDFDGPEDDEFDMVTHRKSSLGESCADSIATDVNNSVAEQMPLVMPISLVKESSDLSGRLADSHSQWKDFDGPEDDEFDMVTHRKSSLGESCADSIATDVNNSVAEQMPDSAEGGLHSAFCGISMYDFENMNSNQCTKIELIEETVKAAKDNKKTLFSAMESVMNMMKKVELQEKAAEQAKEEAAGRSFDILVKVEELKQMLAHEKEANDMHAGEVYGEKAILATEVRELQARLLSLSDERDNALAILDEMCQTLESRLAAAEKLRKAAELEKLEKEETARNALAEQEVLMDKVVQESKTLKKEAEENAKLREFLVDHGCVVDTLQGEISVICLDVKLLKEKFNEHVPLRKSVSSSQTSCILASSGLSCKSLASYLAPERGDPSECPKEPSPTCSVDAQSLKSLPQVVEKYFSNEKQLSDDGWGFMEEWP